MNKIKYILFKLQDVKLKDLLAVFPMITGLIISVFTKRKDQGIWLICEDQREARDNGYFFFKYLNQEQKQIDSFYAIDMKSPDFNKVSKLGNTIKYGSIKHWRMYFNCKYNISSQKGGKPNAALCAFFELNNIFKNKNVFLQHGIIINELDWLKANKSRFIKFYTSTRDEYNFVKNNFGYDKGVVELTGLSRHDNLHDFNTNENQILIMPTWRSWFLQKTTRESEEDGNFRNSDYLKYWKMILNSSELNELIDRYKLKIIFYPHRNLQPFIEEFSDINPKITLGKSSQMDVQELMKSSKLMITDYSSVFFDMIYMKKPIIFYQFDNEKYRRQQYGKGYFDYFNNPFANAYTNYQEVLKELENIIERDYSVSSEYIQEHERIFKYYDKNNSERIFNTLK